MTSGAPEFRADWPEIWRMIVEDAWFREALATAAKRVLFRDSLRGLAKRRGAGRDRDVGLQVTCPSGLAL